MSFVERNSREQKKESYKDNIRRFYQEYRRMPSYREIMDLLGYKSKNAVYKLVKLLVGEGFVEQDSSGKLIPKNIFGNLRLLGYVEAGFPSPAEEELIDTMNLDEYLIGNKEATFMLKVSGDSMIEAGIQEGDLVLVERGNTPKHGDIVIAEIDGGWTMKYYQVKAGKVWLEPANKKYTSIIPQDTLNIAAIVKAVIRKY